MKARVLSWFRNLFLMKTGHEIILRSKSRITFVLKRVSDLGSRNLFILAEATFVFPTVLGNAKSS
jgi:hypothetical protein